ncbi:hypothetical protein [uncultured Friedmanniella sp.]|uniref:hypothetical protein n=1 Tax=uncultured Friedmanniella sp. TaxID=335381 RepID=UPI0035CAF37F
MSTGPIEELAVPYDGSELAAAVLRRRRTVRSRLVSLGITVVILVLLYRFGGERLQAAGFLAVYGLALVISLAWFAVTVVGYLLARRELGTLGSGTAIRIGRAGVEVAGSFAGWPDVRGLSVVSGGLGRSPRLELRRTSGEPASVPLNQVVVHPATLDSTARAYSAGRHGVDLAALES